MRFVILTLTQMFFWIEADCKYYRMLIVELLKFFMLKQQ